MPLVIFLRNFDLGPLAATVKCNLLDPVVFLSGVVRKCLALKEDIISCNNDAGLVIVLAHKHLILDHLLSLGVHHSIGRLLLHRLIPVHIASSMILVSDVLRNQLGVAHLTRGVDSPELSERTHELLLGRLACE